MRNLFIAFLIFPFIFSCNLKEKQQNSIDEEVSTLKDTEAVSTKSIEKEIDENSVGGEGVIFENGGMSFNIESLESSAKKVEQQLEDIKSNNNYESEDLKKNAIESMELNLKLFQGTFCCTTHNAKHCADSKDLRKLEIQYGCERFMKQQ